MNKSPDPIGLSNLPKPSTPNLAIVNAVATAAPVPPTSVFCATVPAKIVEKTTMTGQPVPASEIVDFVNEPFAAVSSAEALTLSLSTPQRKAIEMLTSGHTLVAAATAAGVNRLTLYRWLKGDAVFVAAYNAWQRDVLDTARGRLLALSDLAVTTVAKSLKCGDARTALRILASIGALEPSKPGSIDPEEIKSQQQIDQKKAKIAIRKAEGELVLDDMRY